MVKAPKFSGWNATGDYGLEGPGGKLMCFLSILSIKCGNWFYWADRAETADRAEIKEIPVFVRI